MSNSSNNYQHYATKQDVQAIVAIAVNQAAVRIVDDIASIIYDVMDEFAQQSGFELDYEC